jgi:hypothetical protein
MATDVNPLSSVVTLLESNYNAANADSINPLIAKIYEKSFDKEPKPNEDYIFVYSEITNKSTTGMGYPNVARVSEVLKIDIRCRPANSSQNSMINDSHARKVLAEVNRVIYSNIVNPDSNFDFIDPDSIEQTDLSNGMRGIFRYVIKINLIDMCRDMTT